jgi:hypothetical protein
MVLLNPRSDYGKEFVPEEIESLLREGTGIAIVPGDGGKNKGIPR